MARRNEVSLIDYVFFMTPYHFSVGRIQGDSIAKLKRDLLKAYPTRDLTGIRWENEKLYELGKYAYDNELISFSKLQYYLTYALDEYW
jgi:hypothetical protein